MSATTYADVPAAPRGRARSSLRLRSLSRPRPELAALLLLAAVLNLWALSRNGFANSYYAATVRSMASSWHDFLFASFDPSGVMTVDKPPLALWVQATAPGAGSARRRAGAARRSGSPTTSPGGASDASPAPPPASCSR